MLGNNNVHKTTIFIDNKKVTLCFTYKVIENIYNNLQLFNFGTSNPLTFIENFSTKENKSTEEYYILLSAFVDGKLSENEVADIVKYSNLDELFVNIMAIIVNELKVDNIFPGEEKEEIKIDDTEETNFLYFWDNSYYAAKVILRMTEEEFYNSTPRTINTLLSIDKRYKRDIIIERDIEIEKAKIRASENYKEENTKEKVKVIECKSLKDLF